MTTQSIYLALAIVLVGPYAIAQRVPTNVPRNRQVSHLPAIDTNVPRGTSLDFLAPSSRNRLHADFQARVDTLRVNSSSYPFANDRFIPNGFQRSSSPALAKLSPQSQIAVIDTAIVRSLGGSFVFPPSPPDTTRHLYSFNAHAKRTSDLTQRLNGDLWVDTLRHTNTYDASNNVLSDLYAYWENGQSVNSFRYTYTYDAQANVLSELYESWSNGQWVNSFRYTYTYDAQGNRLSMVFESSSNGQLLNVGRSTYTYDASKNMLSGLYEAWLNGQWVNNGRSTYTYDANGKQTSYLDEGWSTGQWVNSERGTFTYDVNGKQTSYLHESWSSGQWVDSERGTFTYDASGNRLSELYEYWSNSQWVNSERRTYTYDGQGNLTSLWHYTWLNSSWTPADDMRAGRGITDSAGNYYYYSGYNVTLSRKLIFTGVASQSGNVPAMCSLLQNYPNPFNPSTTIKYELPKSSIVRLSVFDMLGREVSVLVNERRDAGVNEVKFDGSNVASGVYFYRLSVSPLARRDLVTQERDGQAGDFVQSKKLVLLK